MSKKKNTAYKGYQEIVDYFNLVKKQIPKNISLTIKGSRLYFQFKTKHKSRSVYASGENFTILGLNRCLEKSHLISQKLANYESEIEFWDWYNETIKGINKNAVNDILTVSQAIANVESWFFSQNDRRGLERTKETDYKSYYRTYDIYFQKLPIDKKVTYDLLYNTLIAYESDRQQRKYQDCLAAYLKLCEVNELKTIHNKLSKFKLKTNTKKKVSRKYEQQAISLEDFLKLRESVLSIDHKQTEENHVFWMWIYSIQLVYGSGNRIVMPLIPPSHPNIIDLLELKNIPEFNINSYVSFLGKARKNLEAWSLKFLGYEVSQTHTLRKLGNANGIQAGINDTIRCKSLGHSESVNAKYYQNFSGQTTIDLYKNAKRQPMPLENALNLINDLPEHFTKEDVIKLIYKIYNQP